MIDPPDRRLDRPEPTEADLYAERARDEFIRAEAESREQLRAQVVEVANLYDKLARATYGEELADRMRSLLFQALNEEAA